MAMRMAQTAVGDDGLPALTLRYWPVCWRPGRNGDDFQGSLAEREGSPRCVNSFENKPKFISSF